MTNLSQGKLKIKSVQEIARGLLSHIQSGRLTEGERSALHALCASLEPATAVDRTVLETLLEQLEGRRIAS